MSFRFQQIFLSPLRLAWGREALAFVLCAAALPVTGRAAPRPEPASAEPAANPEPGVHSSAVRTGVLETKNELTLRLTADLGSVKILTLEPGAAPVVRYTVRLETDARGPAARQLLDNYVLKAKAVSSGVEITGSLGPQAARSGGVQFWVQFELTVPRSYSVEVNTGAGDIETQDIGGAASFHTQGGNIRAGRIGGPGVREASAGRPVAKLETEGGHIQVLDVAGDVTAFTAGGHINAGNIAGNASLRSGGGHIRAGQIGGRADLETVGGNITVGHAGNYVDVHTGGGQIDFGEVRGSVHAQTGGGGIRVMYVSGPMEVESSGGSICLTRVAGAVQAATAGGTITAWINPDALAGSGTVRLDGASQLASGKGDIIVYLPRNLAATIDATVANGGEQRIEADSALHLSVQSSNRGAGPVHAVAALNGGGAPLRLRTTAGKIRLQFLDSEMDLRESLIRQQLERINQRLKEYQFENVKILEPATPENPARELNADRSDWLESWIASLEVALTGGLREDADEFQKRLVYSPKPAYPALARGAGVQGTVKLQVRVTKEGRVEVLKILEGEPSLADAAIAAVKQWRARPVSIKGKPAEVISSVTFNFQLH